MRTVIGALWRRGAGVPLGLLAVGGLVLSVGGSAAAAPQPTVASVQARLSQLNAQAQKLDQEYDAAQQQLTSANGQLAAINAEVAHDKERFDALRTRVAAIAATAYMTGEADTPQALLTSANPQTILNEASILTELSSSNTAEMNAFIKAAKSLTGAQQSAQRVRDGKLALARQLQAERNRNHELVAQQTALLRQLTPQQQTAALGPSSSGITVGQAPVADSRQAQEAVDFALAQQGCPYVFGGTGPCADGFDCSGLTMEAWAHAGVSIERTSYEQMDSLPAVPLSQLEPGDILGFLDNGHVALYIGNNELVQAPQSGEDVDVETLTGWFLDNLDGAVRP